MTTVSPTPRIVIDDTFGAGFIGALVTAVMYGITTLQTYFYFLYYPKDGLDNKILVSSVWALDTLHFGLVCHTMYYYLVSNYAHPDALAVGHWALFSSVALNVLIASLVQSFFTLRIFRLCSLKVRWWLTSLLALIVLAHFCFGMETVAFFFIKKDFDRLNDVTLYAAMPFAIFAVLSDILIAGALCVLLHGSRTGLKQTNALVTTLIIYAINRCLLTSVVAVIEVIVFAISPKSLWFLAIDFVIGKLYANSLLATLNTRNALRNNGRMQLNTVQMSNLAFGGPEEVNSEGGGHVLDLPLHSSGDRSSSTGTQSTRSRPVGDKDKDKVASDNILNV